MIEVTADTPRKLEPMYPENWKGRPGGSATRRVSESKQKHEPSLAVRYKGQSFELQIKNTRGNIADAFHRRITRGTVMRRRRIRLRSSA